MYVIMKWIENEPESADILDRKFYLDRDRASEVLEQAISNLENNYGYSTLRIDDVVFCRATKETPHLATTAFKYQIVSLTVNTAIAKEMAEKLEYWYEYGDRVSL